MSTLASLVLKVCANRSLDSLHRVASRLGDLLYRLPVDATRTGRRNLELCFPELALEEREQLLELASAHQIASILELGPLWRGPAAAALEWVESISGADEFETALASGRGVIGLLPHVGAWELVGRHCDDRYGFTALYQPNRYGIDSLMTAGRSRGRSKMVRGDRAGIRALFETLSSGRLVLLLPDQNPKGEGSGVFAPFFGIPTYTTTLLSRLARRTQPHVFTLVAERTLGSGFHLAITRSNSAVVDARLEDSVAAVNREVENAVRERPAQFVWHYKRFRQRPAGEPGLY